MKLSRRMFPAVALVASGGWCQSGSRRPAEEEEWDQAYHLASVARSERPKDGFVPTAEIAARVAEAIVSAVYGEAAAAHERPFRARLRGNVWTVIGTLNPPGVLGGVAIVQISRIDGRILFALHTE
jgi:hypothetical protein